MAELGPEKRILLAFALSLLVLVVWSRYMQKKYPPRPPAAPPPATTEAPVPPLPRAEAPPAPPMPGQKVGQQEREIVVETDVARIVFSTRGAVVRSWTLKDYRDTTGEPLDLVHPLAGTHLGYPLSLSLADSEREQALNRALFVASSDQEELRAPAELTLEYSDGKLAARKHLRFRDGNVIELDTQVLAEGRPLEHGVAWRGGFGDASLETNWADLQVVWRDPQKIQRKAAQKIEGKESLSGPFAYGGLEDRYFVAVFLPATPGLRLSVQRAEWKPEGEEKPRPVAQLAASVSDGTPLQLFVGPKSIEALEQVRPPAGGPSLDELVDFGFFGVIARPIFLGMRWIHQHWIPNYGWAIVLLTVAINMALFPLKWKSLQSSYKMQKIAPQVRAIQEKYKKYRFNDPRKQQMQQELMALYREHGVNPIGGCLPLLLQIPFFYAFYKVLVVAIELRHAPWFGWIQDLSARDPYYILPVVMTLTMYVSTKMTPMTTADPAQQKMMTLMPFLFGFLFLTVSSGLVLYWLMSNLVGIGQQYWINRQQRARAEAEKLSKRKKKP